MAERPVSSVPLFDAIQLKLASPEVILHNSHGEVKKGETINYRTFKPEKDGLFCARIFGPVKSYECNCGRYKKMRFQHHVCEKCGVEIISSASRRERMGHIELAAPVAHPWFLRSMPSPMAILLDMPARDILSVIAFKHYIITEPGVSAFSKYSLLTEEQYRRGQEEFGESSFVASTGPEAIREVLASLDLEDIRKNLRAALLATNSEPKRRKITKRLRVVENFIHSKNQPEWMMLTVIAVLPPELRPLVFLDGGRFASSDLNELYRKVINRNVRLKKLIQLRAPAIILRNEIRMLQESIEALFDNSKKTKVMRTSSKSMLKSLSDMIKGKQGRFRQNLLGKRVDYSGRSVIVVGPQLLLHQCGLPKKMALELFRPFIYAKVEMYGFGSITRYAKKMIETERTEVWSVLADVIKEHPVLINRAPTLHRLGIQAFEPVLIEGKAIQLHPLVCTAFNADFDGDQVGVHVPLSVEAQLEARILMMATKNILSPSSGKPIVTPTKDMVLGIYYLSLIKEGAVGEGGMFSDLTEVEVAVLCGYLTIHSRIKFLAEVYHTDGASDPFVFDTSVGRVIIYNTLPKGYRLPFDLVNKAVTSRDVSNLCDMVYRVCGEDETALFVDRLKELGFRYASKSGLSFGKDDMIVPSTKKEYIAQTTTEVMQYYEQYQEGLLTSNERYNKVLDAWTRCSDKVAADMIKGIAVGTSAAGVIDERANSIYLMAHSGARGSPSQIRQLSGMRGLMARPDGRIIEKPIESNFKEGLTALEYFASTSGARKGLADRALRTADSGYLTRRLVDVSQDCVIIEDDCYTKEGLVAQFVIEGGEVMVDLGEVVSGRVSASDIYDPVSGQLIINRDELIDEHKVLMIRKSGIESMLIRSPLFCKTIGGMCVKCYGQDAAAHRLVTIGEAVGIVAAQSIGEPGSQLVLRTFQMGGAVNKSAELSSVDISKTGRLRIINDNTVINSSGDRITMSRLCEAIVYDDNGKMLAKYKIPYGAKLFAGDSDHVEAAKRVAEWDPYSTPILAERTGKIKYVDLIEGASFEETIDEDSGAYVRKVINWKQKSTAYDLRPAINIVDEEGNIITLANGLSAVYFLHVGAIISVANGQLVRAGDILTKLPRDTVKVRDITGGLPRVGELFEVRKPKDASVIASLDGIIGFGKSYKSRRKLVVTSLDGKETVEYIIQKTANIVVNEGDMVQKGDLLIDGSPNPHDILRVKGIDGFARYMLDEIQAVYRMQGVTVSDKHIEVILRQMLQKLEVAEPGDTTYLIGELLSKHTYSQMLKYCDKNGIKPASVRPILQGITKASLQTDSFISSASFQETVRVLSSAAIAGKIDHLRGLKENVMIGRLIPAGTGLAVRRKKLKIAAPSMEEALVAQAG